METPTQKSQFKRNTIISIIGGLILPAILVIFPTIMKQQEYIIVGLLSTILVFLISYYLSESAKYKELRERQDEIYNIIVKQGSYHEAFKESIIPKQFQPFFDVNNQNINSDIVKVILPLYINNFNYYNQDLSVTGQIWAIECFKEFWRSLLARQKNDTTFQHHVLAFDISYARIKEDDEFDIDEVIELQKKFLDNNGKITRVFVGTDDKPSDELYHLFKDIWSHKQYTAYYLKEDQNRNMDFLIIPSECTCQWIYDGKAKTPNKVQINSNVNVALKNEWDVILRKAKKYNLNLNDMYKQRN